MPKTSREDGSGLVVKATSLGILLGVFDVTGVRFFGRLLPHATN